ncbi:MAG: apolipoprotein N-acyltransferase [Azospira sp.]|nr:apolipoprotein N-acyltransferase [Azospira sp.]
MSLPAFVPALAAALSGAAAVLAFAPFGWFVVGWLAMAGLFTLLRRAPTTRRGALVGFAFGCGWFGAGTSWVYVSLSVFGGLPPAMAALSTALFCAALALFPALVGALFVRWRRPGFVAEAVFFTALWTLGEWLRGWLFTGFPWLSLGYSQAPPSPLAGLAPLFGVFGLSLAAAFVGACLAEALRRGLAALSLRAALPLLPALALIGAAWLLGEVRWTVPEGPPVKVALLQGNVPQEMKWRPEKLTESLAIYDELMRAHPATLTVLPETAIPAFLGELPSAYLERLLAHAEAQGGDLLFGVPVGDGVVYANAAVSIGVSPSQIYSKSHLVPFGEFVPPGFRWFLDMMHIPMSNFTPGPAGQPPLVIGGQKVAVNICYEDVFGEEIIAALPEATLLLNLSNTAWFGDSLAQPQHLQIAQLRALETGRPMLRATNTGMTAVVGADGRVQATLPPFTRAALVAEVSGHAGLTPYARWGNVAVLLLCVALLVCAHLPWRFSPLPAARKTK